MTYGRYYPGRFCYGSSGPIKRIRGPSNSTLWIESHLSSPFPVSRRDLAKCSPNFLNDFQQSGNRIINPIDSFPEAFQSRKNFLYYNGALEWSQPRLNAAYFGSQYNPFFGSRDDIDGCFRIRYENLNEALNFNDQFWLMEEVEHVVGLFEALSKLLGNDLRPHLYLEILDMALHFTPIISHYSPEDMFDLIQCMHTITRHETAVVKRMLDAITPEDRVRLYDMALLACSKTASVVGYKIKSLMEGGPLHPTMAVLMGYV